MLVCGNCGHIEDRHVRSGLGSTEPGPCLACNCKKFDGNLQVDTELADVSDKEVRDAQAHLMKTARELGAA